MPLRNYLFLFLNINLIFSIGLRANDSIRFQRHRFALNFSTGYVFGIFGTEYGNKTVYISNSNPEITQIRTRFGAGIQIGVISSYSLCKEISMEVGIQSITGFSHVVMEDYYGKSLSYRNTMQLDQNNLCIGFILDHVLEPKFNLSWTNDLLIGVGNKMHVEELYPPYKDEWLYSGSIAIGWQSRISGSYQLNQKWSLGISGVLNANTWAPTKGKLSSHLNGTVDELDLLTASERSRIFKDDYVVYNSNYDNSVRLRYHYPLHSAGAVLFIRYSF